MRKIKQLSFVLFIFSVLAFSYPVTQVFAQGGGQCDSNPACNPASGTCCGQCDPGPACNPNDPNGIPCCGLEGNNNQHQDPMSHDMDNDDQDNDEINHDRRNDRRHKKNKRGRDRRRELREKLNECLERERNSHQQQQAPSATPQCAPDMATQAQVEEKDAALEEICSILPAVFEPANNLNDLVNGPNPQYNNNYLKIFTSNILFGRSPIQLANNPNYTLGLARLMDICVDAGKLSIDSNGSYRYIRPNRR